MYLHPANLALSPKATFKKWPRTNKTLLHLNERGEKLMVAQRGARTHDPEIKSLMLYRLS